MDVYIQMYNQLNDIEKNNIFNLVNNGVVIESPTEKEKEFINIYDNVDSLTKEQIKNGFNMLHNRNSEENISIMSMLNNVISQSNIGQQIGELEIVSNTIDKIRKIDDKYKERKNNLFSNSNLFILSAILIISFIMVPEYVLTVVNILLLYIITKQFKKM
jgi:hypothetical protein